MTCCNGKGLIRLNWSDAPDDFAVCLCHVGLDMRAEVNNGKATVPLWHVWCAREQVDTGRVIMVEDILGPEELAERGLVQADASRPNLLTLGRKGKR
jgi:hypothetical protein